MIRSNFHTHTRFCDGKDEPEVMVKRAIELGFTALGFSGHSDTGFDPCGMRDTDGYIAEIKRLSEKYRNEIEIYCGIEQDYFSGRRDPRVDYAIGSVHYVLKNGKYLCVDWSKEETDRVIREEYAGDQYAFAEDYFKAVGDIRDVTGCDIVGHFDLIRKFDEYGEVFSEENERYRAAALSALDKLCSSDIIFEINTGAMARGYRKTPFPSVFILSEIKRRGAKIMVNSDCHNAEKLDFGFSEAAEIARSVGFSSVCVLSNGKFTEIAL